MELYKNQITMTFTETKKRVMRLLMENVDWSQYYGLAFSSGEITVQGNFNSDHVQLLKNLKFKCTVNSNGHVSCVRGSVKFLYT